MHWLLGHLGLLLGADMGIGKSKLALDLAYLIGCVCILILCPLRVIEVWEVQLQQHAMFPYLLAALDDRVNGTERKAEMIRDVMARARAMGRTAVICINYDSMRLEPVASLLLHTPWSLVIADECHRIGSASGKQSRFAGKLARVALHRLGLTGTPLTQSPDSAYGIYRFVDWTVYPPTHAEFLAEFAKKGGYMDREIKEWIEI